MTARTYATILFVIGIIISFFINIYAFGVALIAAIILIAYASRLKKTMLAGNVAISILVALTFIYGGLINFSLENATTLIVILPLAVLAFLANMGREICKTIEDALGDKKEGAQTFAVKYGVLKTRSLASAFIILAILLSFVPFLIGTFGLAYLIVVVIADIVFVVAASAPVKHASKLTKFAMLIALIAFLIGAIFK
jgi:geranylgeranylglycerol-phosphate geranylgeranyltransferase